MKAPSNMSMKEYINKITLLASAFIGNMKKEVEARQYTIVGSNLLEETGMEEDRKDKQLQNSFLTDGSTIEEEVDTTAEGQEEEEETNVNKMWRSVLVALCAWRKT